LWNSYHSLIFNHMVQYQAGAPPLDQLFHALSDPTRRAIMARLTRGPALVTELAAPFATSLNAVSKHLRVLERAGLLRREVRGREHHCALEPGPLEGAAEWIAFYRRFWEHRLDALEALLIERGEARPAPRSGGSRARRPRR